MNCCKIMNRTWCSSDKKIDVIFHNFQKKRSFSGFPTPHYAIMLKIAINWCYTLICLLSIFLFIDQKQNVQNWMVTLTKTTAVFDLNKRKKRNPFAFHRHKITLNIFFLFHYMYSNSNVLVPCKKKYFKDCRSIQECKDDVILFI